MGPIPGHPPTHTSGYDDADSEATVFVDGSFFFTFFFDSQRRIQETQPRASPSWTRSSQSRPCSQQPLGHREEFGKKQAPSSTDTRWQPLCTSRPGFREWRGFQKVRVTQKARDAERPLQSTQKLRWALIVPLRSLLGKMTLPNKYVLQQRPRRLHKQGGA